MGHGSTAIYGEDREIGLSVVCMEFVIDKINGYISLFLMDFNVESGSKKAWVSPDVARLSISASESGGYGYNYETSGVNGCPSTVTFVTTSFCS